MARPLLCHQGQGEGTFRGSRAKMTGPGAEGTLAVCLAVRYRALWGKEESV
jgi:hypothetical protein